MLPPLSPAAQRAGELSTPTRNRYFYGKLLDVLHFQTEQQYFLKMDRLVNRLGLGTGILCGLEVMLNSDGARLGIMAGVAVDPLGRVIVIPTSVSITLAELLGEREAVGEAGATLCLRYRECEAEPEPVLVGGCNGEEPCAPSLIRERFELLLVDGTPSERPPSLGDEQCAAIFPAPEPPEEFDRWLAACESLGGDCVLPQNDCVVLAVLTVGEDGTLQVDNCTWRRLLPSNATLFELILCLADRVDACCRVLDLRYVSGDAQSAEPGTTLPEPLVVEVVDGNEQPQDDIQVTFRIRGGGGRVGRGAAMSNEFRVTTGEDGRASIQWRLGPAAGLNSVMAILGRDEVSFHALGIPATEPPPPADLPVVLDQWPPVFARLTANDPEPWRLWMERQQLHLTFSHAMRENQLRAPARWLRVWELQDAGEIIIRRLFELELGDLREESMSGVEGPTAVYLIGDADTSGPRRYLVVIRAEGGNIQSEDTPRLLLDADFAGSDLTVDELRELWEVDSSTSGDRRIWEALVDTGATLPQSGNDDEGGWYHAWFEVEAG